MDDVSRRGVLLAGSGGPSVSIAERQTPALPSARRSRSSAGLARDPAETAAAADFLASSDSSFMTGSEMFVDGELAQV